MSFDHDMNADAKTLDQNDTTNEALDSGLDQAIEAGELGADAPTTGTPFSALGLHDALLRAVKDSGYENTTEVQAQAIPPALEGKDLMVSSRTGSGKTASFILPALQQVLNARAERAATNNKTRTVGPRVLVLAPTRELAMQVAKSAMTYGRHIQGLRVATVLGGMPYAQQLRALSGPLDVLIATPGRLLDHINSGRCKLDNVTMFVLDEADRMLDMGFIDDINFVAEQIPAERQTLMYSATFAGNTGRLASQLMKDPQRIDVSGHTESHENIEQRLHWADNGQHKRKLLEHILGMKDVDQAVVFTSTQQDTEWLAEQLEAIGHRVAALHGGMPQGKRTRTLMALRRRDLRVLVATDVAARGIDVPTISHVINFGLPMKAEDYVHRIGRTGRAGRSGLAVTLAERGDISMIKRIQQFTTQAIPVSRIEGLEPRNEEPKIYPSRPGFDRGDRGGTVAATAAIAAATATVAASAATVLKAVTTAAATAASTTTPVSSVRKVKAVRRSASVVKVARAVSLAARAASASSIAASARKATVRSATVRVSVTVRKAASAVRRAATAIVRSVMSAARVKAATAAASTSVVRIRVSIVRPRTTTVTHRAPSVPPSTGATTTASKAVRPSRRSTRGRVRKAATTVASAAVSCRARVRASSEPRLGA